MSIDRRQFVQTVGGAGVFAALAQPGAAQPARAGDDFEKPAGLRPGAQLDSRFPVSFAKPVSEGLPAGDGVLHRAQPARRAGDRPHAAFSVRHLREHRADRRARARPISSRARRPASTAPARARAASCAARTICSRASTSTSTARSAPRSRCRSRATRRTATSCSPATACTRSRTTTAGGASSSRRRSSTRSTSSASPIPTPKPATTRAEQNYLGAFGYRNEAILNDPTTSRGTYEPPWPVGTRTASVNFGYGPRERSRDAREGHPMSGWKTKGVKSRLAVGRCAGRSEPRDRHQPGRVQRAGRRRGGRVRLHPRSPGPPGRDPRDARQGAHPGRATSATRRTAR